MIVLCPFCGQKIGRPLEFGSALCGHCQGVFRTDFKHEVLAAAQLIRRRNVDESQLTTTYKVPVDAANFVIEHVVERGLSHDELHKEIQKHEQKTA